MKRLISQSFILLSFTSLAQPGDLNLSTKIVDSVKFIVLDSLGDTITSENIDFKNFSINTFHVWDTNNLPYCLYLSEEPPFETCAIDSIGIVRDQYSVILDLSYESNKSILWNSDAWILHVKQNDQQMKVLINRLDAKIVQMNEHSTHVIKFNPGNYYLLDKPAMYFNNGFLISNPLISLDETQPEELEKLFEYYHVREKLCM